MGKRKQKYYKSRNNKFKGTRRKQWLEIIGRPDLLTVKHYSHYVCSLHFDKTEIKHIPQLLTNALPMKVLPKQPTTSKINTQGDSCAVSTQTADIIKGPDKKSSCSLTASENETDSTQTSLALSTDTPRKRKLKRKKWLEVIGRPDLLTKKHNSHFVCSLHFDKTQIKHIPQLSTDAVPMKVLPNQPNTSKINTQGDNCDISTQTAAIIKGPDTKSLCSQTASENETDSTQTSLALSTDTSRKRKLKRKKWLEVIGRPDLLTKKHNSHFVCSLHFDKTQINHIPQLSTDAVPMKVLPNQPNTSKINTQGDNCDISTQTAAIIKGPDTKSLCSQTASENETDSTQTSLALSTDTSRKRKLKIFRVFSIKENDEKFFDMIKERPQLWDVDNPEYNVEDEAAWMDIIKALSPGYDEAKPENNQSLAKRTHEQWLSIQRQFREKIKSGTPYQYEEHLGFIREILTREVDIKVEPDDTRTMEDPDPLAEADADEDDEEEANDGPDSKKIKLEVEVEEQEEEAVFNEEDDEEEDEELTFFASITETVKSLPEAGKQEFRNEVMKLLKRLQKKHKVFEVPIRTRARK